MDNLLNEKRQALSSIVDIVAESKEQIKQICNRAATAIDKIVNTKYNLLILNADQKRLVKTIIEDALYLKTPINSITSHTGNNLLAKCIYAAILRSHFKSSIEEISALIFNNRFTPEEKVYQLFINFDLNHRTNKAFRAKYNKCVNLCTKHQINMVKIKEKIT